MKSNSLHNAFLLTLPLFFLIIALCFLAGVIFFAPTSEEQMKARAAREAKRRNKNRKIAEESYAVQIDSSSNKISGQLTRSLDNQVYR